MGRFYDGDIEGKFWFGIQDSNDIEELVSVTPYIYYSWKVCGCAAEVDSDEYCKGCYMSKEEHIEDAVENEEYEDEMLYMEDSSQGYCLDKDTHYDELKKNMEELRKKIPEIVLNEFDKIEQNDKLLNAFTGVFDNTSEVVSNYFGGLPQLGTEKRMILQIIARYNIGLQIEYCLRTSESCNVNCDY
jgi:hypothetical protein